MSQRITLDRHTIRALVDGRCTRVVKHGPQPKAGECQVFRFGQPGGAVCRLEILSAPVGTTFDGLMPDGDVRSALEHGAPTTSEFRRRWLAQHDRTVKRMDADRIADLTEPDITGFWASWRPVQVWSLHVRLDTIVRERYLAAAPSSDRVRLLDEFGTRLPNVPNGGDMARGYVTVPSAGLPGEGAAVDDVDLLRFAGEAGDELAARRRQELFDLERQLRSVRWLRGDADARDLRAIERRLAAMRRRSDRRAA